MPTHAGGRHYAYAMLTDSEYAVIKAVAKKDGLTISNFVRRCVNGYLLELGDDVPLLAEFVPGTLPRGTSPNSANSQKGTSQT